MEKKTLDLGYVENEEMEDTSPREVNAKAKELLNLCKEADVPVLSHIILRKKVTNIRLCYRKRLWIRKRI